MEENDLSRININGFANYVDDLMLEKKINFLDEAAREYSKVATTAPATNKRELEFLANTYCQIIGWLRELQKYRKMYPQDRTSGEVD